MFKRIDLSDTAPGPKPNWGHKRRSIPETNPERLRMTQCRNRGSRPQSLAPGDRSAHDPNGCPNATLPMDHFLFAGCKARQCLNSRKSKRWYEASATIVAVESFLPWSSSGVGENQSLYHRSEKPSCSDSRAAASRKSIDWPREFCWNWIRRNVSSSNLA